MIRTFSEPEIAIEAIPNFCKHCEQDIFVYHVKYPGGDEYSLRKRDEIISEDSSLIIHKYYLPITHCFTNRDNVLREAEVWAQRLNANVIIDSHYKYEKGYRIFSHYTIKSDV